MLIDRTQVVEEQVRAILKPFFKSGMIDKHAYKEIMRKAVPKVFPSVHTPGFSIVCFFLFVYIVCLLCNTGVIPVPEFT